MNQFEEFSLFYPKLMFYGGGIVYLVSFYTIWVSYSQMDVVFLIASAIVFLLWLVTHMFFMYVFREQI